MVFKNNFGLFLAVGLNCLASVSANVCCRAITAQCLACTEGVTVEEFCKDKTMKIVGCGGLEDFPKLEYEYEYESFEYEIEYEKDEEHEEYEYEYEKKEYEPFVPEVCCTAMTPLCIACSKGISRVEFCRDYKEALAYPECNAFRNDPAIPLPEKNKEGTDSTTPVAIWIAIAVSFFIVSFVATLIYCRKINKLQEKDKEVIIHTKVDIVQPESDQTMNQV